MMTRWLVPVLTLLHITVILSADLNQNMKYLWGDFLTQPDLKGPDGYRYPRELIDKLYTEGEFGGPARGSRRGRTLMPTLDPVAVQNKLLRSYSRANFHGGEHDAREVTSTGVVQNLVIGGVEADVKISATSEHLRKPTDSLSNKAECPKSPSVPARLCPTKYNTTAPMYGVSLTSGQPVTIVQKFPDLLQQVIFEVCQSDTCDVLQGSCVQTYVPYLFLVIPLGPVTLTGQDYVLVESGCMCQPKYGRTDSGPSPIDALNIG